jgi:hypothetical protein
MSDFAQMQEVIEHLCGGPVWTHELLAVADACRDEVLRQRPDLADVVVPDLTSISDKGAFLNDWLIGQAKTYGDRVTLNGGLAARRNKGPIETLTDLVGAERVIPIVLDES